MSDNTKEQDRAVVDAIRYATGDDCQMTDGEAAVAIKAMASPRYVLVARALVEAAADGLDPSCSDMRLLALASRLRATLEPKP